MTLDDAIVAFGQLTSDDFDSLELDVRDYERLVKWLTELKLARESAFSDIGLAARAVSENHQLKAENAKLRDGVAQMYRDMQGVLVMSSDTVWVDRIGTLRDRMDRHMQAMAELGMPPADYESRMRELGIEVN